MRNFWQKQFSFSPLQRGSNLGKTPGKPRKTSFDENSATVVPVNVHRRPSVSSRRIRNRIADSERASECSSNWSWDFFQGSRVKIFGGKIHFCIFFNFAAINFRNNYFGHVHRIVGRRAYEKVCEMTPLSRKVTEIWIFEKKFFFQTHFFPLRSLSLRNYRSVCIKYNESIERRLARRKNRSDFGWLRFERLSRALGGGWKPPAHPKLLIVYMKFYPYADLSRCGQS